MRMGVAATYGSLPEALMVGDSAMGDGGDGLIGVYGSVFIRWSGTAR